MEYHAGIRDPPGDVLNHTLKNQHPTADSAIKGAKKRPLLLLLQQQLPGLSPANVNTQMLQDCSLTRTTSTSNEVW